MNTAAGKKSLSFGPLRPQRPVVAAAAAAAAILSRSVMDTDTCLPFSSQSSSSRRTPENSPRLEHGSSGSFLSCDELQKPPHLAPPLPQRLGLRGDLYAAAMGRFGEAAADFSHGAATVNPPGSPSKHKFLDSISQEQKTAAMSGKPVFYDGNSEGESSVVEKKRTSHA